MKLPKLSVNCDLSEMSFEMALKECYTNKDNDSLTLYVSSELLKTGEHITWKYKNCKLVLDDELPSDAWYVKNQWFGVFSPGA